MGAASLTNTETSLRRCLEPTGSHNLPAHSCMMIPQSLWVCLAIGVGYHTVSCSLHFNQSFFNGFQLQNEEAALMGLRTTLTSGY